MSIKKRKKTEIIASIAEFYTCSTTFFSSVSDIFDNLIKRIQMKMDGWILDSWMQVRAKVDYVVHSDTERRWNMLKMWSTLFFSLLTHCVQFVRSKRTVDPLFCCFIK